MKIAMNEIDIKNSQFSRSFRKFIGLITLLKPYLGSGALMGCLFFAQ